MDESSFHAPASESSASLLEVFQPSDLFVVVVSFLFRAVVADRGGRPRSLGVERGASDGPDGVPVRRNALVKVFDRPLPHAGRARARRPGNYER